MEFLQSVNRTQSAYFITCIRNRKYDGLGAAPVVPLGLIQRDGQGMEAMQKKHDEDARKHLDKAAAYRRRIRMSRTFKACWNWTTITYP